MELKRENIQLLKERDRCQDELAESRALVQKLQQQIQSQHSKITEQTQIIRSLQGISNNRLVNRDRTQSPIDSRKSRSVLANYSDLSQGQGRGLSRPS